MITIQKVSEALHEIETKVFQDLSVNPFRQDVSSYLLRTENFLKGVRVSKNNNEIKENVINACAVLTRLISELP